MNVIFEVALSSPNPFESDHHSHIVGVRWRDANGKVHQSTRAQIIIMIHNGFVFYTNQGGKAAKVVVRNDRGVYIQTVADGYYQNNLLMLPRFAMAA